MSAAVYPITYTVGDTLPEIAGVIAGAYPVDITNYTITLHVKRPSTTALSVDAILVEPAQGKFKFVFSAGELVAGFCQEAEVQFVLPGGATMTAPSFFLNVREQIA